MGDEDRAVLEGATEPTLNTPVPAKWALSLLAAPLSGPPQVPADWFRPAIESVAAVEVPLGRLSFAPLARLTLVVTVVAWLRVTVPAVLLMVRELTVAGNRAPAACAAVPV